MTFRDGIDSDLSGSGAEIPDTAGTDPDPARPAPCNQDDQERSRGDTAPSRDKERAAALLFRPKVLGNVMHWLKRLGVPLRHRSDVAGDVWLDAVTSWPTYDPALARPERWLNRITVFVASHALDRAHHRREELAGEPRIDVVDPAPDAPTLIDQEERRIGVLVALKALDQGVREVLLAHDIEEIPMAEIAEQMGIPLSTLYKLRTRALVALRAEIERRMLLKE